MEEPTHKEKSQLERAYSLWKKLAPSLKWILIIALGTGIGNIISFPALDWYSNNQSQESSIDGGRNDNDMSSESASYNIAVIPIDSGITTVTDGEFLGKKGDFNTSADDVVEVISEAENNDDFLPVAKREIIEWEGRTHLYMTYGRRVFKNLDESSNYKYFIVEPHDYTENGADKYSPTTRNLTGKERVKIVGTIANYCWWNEEGYDGCVPWVDAENMEVISRDE